jgi:ATP-dependent DNA helicase RecQ
LETPLSILKKYWGHSQFRPLQENIIQSVLNGKDTLALLPTGGGKSVCFQIPALLLEGVCVVITPLIALMKDQVEQLKKREIEAVSIHSGLSRRQIDITLDNCIFGKIKFLYISPERLHTEIFQERVKQMHVCLIAVDEAHCISQWGYDFRPAYLTITTLRELKPDVPVIALTATATREVQRDIVEKLSFRRPSEVFTRTFARDNLSFVVRKTENKDKKLLEVLQRVKGSAILYVRSRKATQEIAAWLNKKGIRASFYNAGLDHDTRARRQDEWIKNNTRVMVATNAFGMGIDKPDVRLVIHLDLPENIESYYQEAGRAGRDGQRAFAAIVYQDADIASFQMKVEQAHPPVEYLKTIYQALANQYQLALGSGEGESFDFDLPLFSEKFHFHAPEVYNALKKLEEEGLIQFSESFYSPSQLHMLVDSKKLYEFQVANGKFDPLAKMLLRLYGGEMYSSFVKISEAYLARALKISLKETIAQLKHMNELGVIAYQPVKDSPQIVFVMPRQDADHLPLDYKRLEERKSLALSKMKAMVNFVENGHQCRMQFVQDYFNEDSDKTCGICDVCIGKRKVNDQHTWESMKREIVLLISGKTMSVEQLEEVVAPRDRELFIEAVRELVDEGKMEYDKSWKLKISKP